MINRKIITNNIHFFLQQFRKPHVLTLIIILIIGFFFRFYNTPFRYGFDYDPTRDALIVAYGVQDFSFPLLGAPNVWGPFHFGPWYYYQLIIFSILFPIDFAPWIYIGIISLIFIFLMYKIGNELEGKTFGLLLALFAAFSPAQTGPTQGLSNPNLIPFFSAVAVWIFIVFIKKNPPLWCSFLWGLTLGIGFNIHFQIIGLFILPIIVATYDKTDRLKRLALFALGGIVSLVPFIIVNLRTEFKELNGFIFYLQHARSTIPYRWLFYVRDFFYPFWSYLYGVTKIFGLGLLIYAFLIAVIQFFSKKMRMVYILLFLTLGFNIIITRYFMPQRDNYYLLYIHPLLFIFLGYALLQLFKNKIGIVIGVILITLIIIQAIPHNIERLKSREDQEIFRSQARILTKIYPNKKFAVYACNKNQRNLHPAQGLAFFLHNSNLLDDDSIKIGILPDACKFGDTWPATPYEDREEFYTNYLQYDRIHELEGVDISEVSHEQLIKDGWYLITPKTVYDLNVES